MAAFGRQRVLLFAAQQHFAAGVFHRQIEFAGFVFKDAQVGDFVGDIAGVGLAVFAAYAKQYAQAVGNLAERGIGRIGAFVSAFVGAWFLNWGWDFKTVAIVLTIPALLVGIALWTKGAVYRQRS